MPRATVYRVLRAALMDRILGKLKAQGVPVHAKTGKRNKALCGVSYAAALWLQLPGEKPGKPITCEACKALVSFYRAVGVVNADMLKLRGKFAPEEPFRLHLMDYDMKSETGEVQPRKTITINLDLDELKMSASKR